MATTPSQLPLQADDRFNLWAPRAVVAVTAAAIVLVMLDTGGPIRGPVVALALLVAPGLSASLLMSPMSHETRALISVAGSGALLTLIATVMAVFGVWSPGAGLLIIAVVVSALVLIPSGRSGRERDHATGQKSEPIDPDIGVTNRGGNEHDHDG